MSSPWDRLSTIFEEGSSLFFRSSLRPSDAAPAADAKQQQADEENNEPEQRQQQLERRPCCYRVKPLLYVVICLLILAIGAAVFLGICGSEGCGKDDGSGRPREDRLDREERSGGPGSSRSGEGPTFSSAASSTSADQPVPSTIPPSEEIVETALVPFQSTEELYKAIDDFIVKREMDALKLKYGPIEQWDVHQLTNFTRAFDPLRSIEIFLGSADPFNEDLSAWNMSAAIDASFMFAGATAFNSNLGSWDVGNVHNMSHMFDGALSFEGTGLESWNVHMVTDLSFAFANAERFDASLCDWMTRVGALTRVDFIFDGSGCPSMDAPAFGSVGNIFGLPGPWCSVC